MPNNDLHPIGGVEDNIPEGPNVENPPWAAQWVNPNPQNPLDLHQGPFTLTPAQVAPHNPGTAVAYTPALHNQVTAVLGAPAPAGVLEVPFTPDNHEVTVVIGAPTHVTVEHNTGCFC